MDINIDLTKTKIETDRLILRAWQESDLNDFYEYASVEGVGEMAGWPHHDSIDVTRNVLRSFISNKNHFAIIHNASNKVIGSIGLHESWANSELDYAHLKLKEIGYTLSKKYWGQGIMPEAVSAVIKYCFSNLGLDALTTGHSPTNKQSQRVIEKCGFKYVTTKETCTNDLQQSFYGMKYILQSAII